MADTSPHSYILLREISEEFPRGTLLQLKEDGSYEEHSHTAHIYHVNQPETIRCDNDGDVAPLSGVECCLLDGISSEDDRYDIYSTPGKLEWGRSLKVGDTVLARLPGLRRCGSSDGGQQHHYTTAIIRWCGRMRGEGYKFGVEIVVSSYIV